MPPEPLPQRGRWPHWAWGSRTGEQATHHAPHLRASRASRQLPPEGARHLTPEGGGCGSGRAPEGMAEGGDSAAGRLLRATPHGQCPEESRIHSVTRSSETAHRGPGRGGRQGQGGPASAAPACQREGPRLTSAAVWEASRPERHRAGRAGAQRRVFGEAVTQWRPEDTREQDLRRPGARALWTSCGAGRAKGLGREGPEAATEAGAASRWSTVCRALGGLCSA